MEKSLHVYVCSTYRDLVSERNRVLEALEELSVQYPAFTYCCSRSILPLDVCRTEIKRCDAMILIVGHVHGVIAPGLDVSHGEAEYAEGRALGKPILVYFRDPKSGLYPVHFERDPQKKALLDDFKARLHRDHPLTAFSDIHSLADQVTADLSKLVMDSGLESQVGGKPAKFRARTGETRAASAGSPGTVRTSSTADAPSNQTIPGLQKALVAPVKRPGSGFFRRGGILLVSLVLLGGLFWLYRVGIIRKISMPTNASSSQAPAKPAAVADSAAVLPPPRPDVPPQEIGTVSLVDDTDTSRTFIRRAQEGDREAQLRMGAMYESGHEALRNDTLAFKWYYKAAKQGSAEAQYKVASMYRAGQGVVKSVYRAAQWFTAAAEQGHAKSQFRLGQLYQSGKGVPRNETTAFKWFLKAADQNDSAAQKVLTELKGN